MSMASEEMNRQDEIETALEESTALSDDIRLREAMADESEESIAAAMHANAVLISVSTSRLGVRRRVQAERVAVDGVEVDVALVSTNKKLLDCEEYDAITTLDGRFYTAMICRVLSSQYRKGTYMLPVRLITWFEETFAAYLVDRELLIDEFLNAYTIAQEDARVRLEPNGLYDASDYPSRERVREAFAVSRQYQQIGVPDKLAALHPSLFQLQQKQMANEIASAGAEVRRSLRTGLLDMVNHLQEKLTPSADGTKKRLHNSTVDNLQQWLELFEDRNITNDQPLAEVVAKLRAATEGVDKDMLKNDDDLIEETQKAFTTASNMLGAMVQKNVRRIRFE